MSALFEAYNFPVCHLISFYKDINEIVHFPDGTSTYAGIIYWGKPEHYTMIEAAADLLTTRDFPRISDVYEAIRTPGRTKKFMEAMAISNKIVRILKHDIELWLPKSIPLERFKLFQKHPEYRRALNEIGLTDQLDVVSEGCLPEL